MSRESGPGNAVEAQGNGISVVVVSFNTRALLDACLESLAAHDVSGDELDVIVVDNGSQDGSAELVRDAYPRARLLQMGGNAGFARASNAGIRASRGRYIVLLNSDTVVHNRALHELAAFLEQHTEYAAAGPLLLNPDGSMQTSCFSFTTVLDILFEQAGLTAIFPHSGVFNRRGLGDFDRSTVRAVDWVSGACLMVRRSVLATVGLLDEGFFMYGEELDWCYRMRQHGLRTAFYPHARVVHVGRASSLHAPGELAPRAVAGRLRYFQKHHGAGAVLAVRVLMALGMASRIALLPLRALWRGRRMGPELSWYCGLLRGALAPTAAPASTPGKVDNG